MPTELRGPRGVLAFRGTTAGDVATSAFVLCATTGVLLIPSYDAHNGMASIADWLLVDHGAAFLRNVHYWTAQVFLAATALHIGDHLRVASERRVARGPWLRLALSIPVIGFLMLSGFLLRGDSDAQQARRIVNAITAQVPVAGPLVATFLFGAGDQLHVVYLQHAATATIIVGLVLIEHTRRMWPRAVPTAIISVTASVVAIVLSPGLHDGLDPAVKGPWYFVGLQEALHWTPWPLVTVAAGVAGVALIWVLPRLAAPWPARAKRALLLAFGAYALLGAVGLFLRGDNWRLQPNWPGTSSDWRSAGILSSATIDSAASSAKVPIVMGRAEGCLVCHAGVTGLGDAHRPEAIGCASCHAGNVFTLDAARAHTGMILRARQPLRSPRGPADRQRAIRPSFRASSARS